MVEINTNLDTTPLPPNNLVAQDPQSAELAGYVRTKTFGRDVRESIARSIELNSTRSKSAEILANETVNVANDLTERFNAQIGALTEDSEVIDARGGKDTLGKRLDADKEDIRQELTKRGADVTWFAQNGEVTAGSFEEAFKAGAHHIILERDQEYIITSPILLYQNLDIDANGATIIFEETDGFIVNNANDVNDPEADWRRIPTIRNAYLKYNGTGKHSVIKTGRGWWGGRINLIDVRIRGAYIGLSGLDVYHCKLEQLVFDECQIGVFLGASQSMSNLIDLTQISFFNCKYGLVADHLETSKVFSCTFQHCESAIVINKVYYSLEVDSCYFEDNDRDIIFGIVNPETLEVVEHTTANQRGLFNYGLKFRNNRGGLTDSSEFFFGENHKFVSFYGDYSDVKYPNNLDTFMTSGLAYRNLANPVGLFKNSSDVDEITYTVEMTPFGRKRVVSANLMGGNVRANSLMRLSPYDGHHYLVKMKVWTDKSISIKPELTRNDTTTVANGESFLTLAGGWSEYSGMIYSSVGDRTGSWNVMFRLSGIDNVRIKVTDMIIVDLTDIMGVDVSPGIYMTKLLSKYFTFVPTLQWGNTGYASKPNGFSTEKTFRPLYPLVGESYFDSTLGKPIWAKQEAVISSSGSITQQAIWVDSTGSAV